jgi:hypothetical protein
MKPTLTLIIALVFAPLVSPTLAQSNDGRTITLADDGRARYRIVAASDADGIEDYAAQTLAGYLKEMTGAEFPVVSPDDFKVDRPAIFVGLSEPALARLGREPLAKLRDQEHVARSVGQDILLYGKGHRASLDAVMEFLENSLGLRWYSPFEKPVVPKLVTLNPFSRQRGFDFVSRQLAARFDGDFYLQHSVNMGVETKLRNRGQTVPGHLRSWLPNENFVHTPFAYIPPTPNDKYANGFQWVTKRNYFETNPEFFSIGASGKRLAQIEFSNTERTVVHSSRQIVLVDTIKLFSVRRQVKKPGNCSRHKTPLADSASVRRRCTTGWPSRMRARS